MAEAQQLKISNVPMTAISQAQPTQVAMGMRLSKIQNLAQVMADEQAPHFPVAAPPVADGTTFRAMDGVLYYRPKLRVAQRAAPAFGPEVRFLKDADGKVRLVFELEEDPDSTLPAGARPLNVKVDSVVLQWNGGQRNFAEPTLLDEEALPNSTTPAFAIRVGAELNAAEVEALNGALSNTASGARLEVGLSYGYWLDSVTVPPVIVQPPMGRIPMRPATPVARPVNMAAARPLAVAAARPVAVGIDPRAATLHREAVPVAQLKNRAALTEAAATATLHLQRQSNFHRATLSRLVPFTFDPNLEQNRLVFAGIRGSETVRETWTDTEFGPIRKAPYPNTIYHLPQEVRLAFNQEMGTAHVIPHLYRDERDEIRVRVTVRAVPWFDPEKVVALRDHLYRSSGGALASPRVIAGGYQRATLQLLTAFPDQIKILNENVLSVDLAGGVDLTLDVTLEFYRFIGEMLTGPVGIIGEVRVLLQEASPGDGQPPVKLERVIPVRLRLDTFANFPMSVTVEDEAVRPDEITILNQSPGEVLIGNCLPRLLQIDSNSVVPLEVFDAEIEDTFPKTVRHNEALTVKVKPRIGGDSMLWNAVEVSLVKIVFSQAPAQVLERIHEVAPSGTLSWRLKIECPAFESAPIPEQFSNLFRVEVQISRSGFATQQIVVGRDQPDASITMQRTLKDLMNTTDGGQFTFRYRVRNVYFDHIGKWGEEQQGNGSNVFVFPNAVAND